MKTLFFITLRLCCIFLFVCIKINAQHIGIGTSNPQATLEVKGNYRMGGIDKYILFDSITGRIEWKNANLYVPVSQFLVKHSAAGDGLYYNNTNPITGQLEYRNAAGEPVFFTNFINNTGYFKGNLGIGITSPASRLHVSSGAVRFEGPANPGSNIAALSLGGYGDVQVDAVGSAGGRFVIKENGFTGIGLSAPIAPLSFKSITGQKISFYGDGHPSYGIGVQPFLLQIHTDSDASDIGFGYGQSTSFTELMKIKGNGNVGIGTPAPFYRLDVAGRMRLRHNGGSAGIWFNNNANQEAAFTGMETDTYIGFYGNNGAGWRFSMNTETGALKINGSEGTAGQVLQSNGMNAPTWSSSTNSLFNNTVQVIATDSVPVTESLAWTTIPGMTYSFNLAGVAKIIVMFNVKVFPGFCVGCNTTSAHIGVYVNGIQSRTWNQNVQNSTAENFTGTYLLQLGPGNHTIDLRGMKTGPSAYFALGGSTVANNMILQVIHQ